MIVFQQPTQQQVTIQQNRPHAVTVRQPQQQQQMEQQQMRQLQLQQLQQLQQQSQASPVSVGMRPQQQIYKKSNAVAMTEAVSLPLGVPAFRRIPSLAEDRSSISNSIDPQAQNTFNRKVMYQHPVLNQVRTLSCENSYRKKSLCFMCYYFAYALCAIAIF